MQQALLVRGDRARPAGRLHSAAWTIVGAVIAGTVAIVLEGRTNAGAVVPPWLLVASIVLAAVAVGTMTFFVVDRRMAERRLLRSVDEELAHVRAESERVTRSLDQDGRQLKQATTSDS